MKTNDTRLQAEFGPEIRFEVNPVMATPARGALETALERLKERLLRDTLRVSLNIRTRYRLY